MPIREAGQSDLEGILELYRQLNPDDPELSPDKAHAIWDEILSGPFSRYFVAVDSGRIVSSCCISIIPNLTRSGRPFAVIENVITERNFRNRGFGSMVLRAAVDYAESSDCYKVVLLSGVKRSEAHSFYEKQGFDGSSKKGFEIRFA